jgi:TPR repeat protein
MGVNKWPVTMALSMLVAIGAATAASNDKGLEAYQAGDFKTALSAWLTFAEQGNASAQSNLGMMYDHGNGVLQSDETALKWYTLAAEQGDVVAQSNLAGMYDVGRGVPESDKTAVKWLTLAAGQGYGPAQSYLGVMYVNGEGVATDYLRAYMWWSLAAQNGDQLGAQYRQSIASKMTSAHIAKAQKMLNRCVYTEYAAC